MDKKKNVLIGVTGSVATIKVVEIVEQLAKTAEFSLEIRLVSTEPARHFISREMSSVLEQLGVPVLGDKEEWNSWGKRGDPVLHIELRKWADVMAIAPLDANTLAKISTGQADNLLTCVCRAWDFSKPILFAPAMNTFMWQHPVTEGQVGMLKSWGYEEIPCIEKLLVCQDRGMGAMAEPEVIVERILSSLK